VQPQTPKHVPNTVPYFKGLINIRGQVVGLVDLRVRFGYQSTENAKQALLVFDTEAGPIAATVDHVEAVIRTEDKDIHKNPNIQSQVPMEFMIGVIHHQDRLVTLIDLNRTFSQEDYVEIGRGKITAA
jgi:purine-binding chemotaxis protein CheW